MSNKNIDKDIEIANAIVKVNKDFLKNVEKQTINQREIQAIENVLLDRERKIEDIQRLQETLDKSDANNVELQKEIETLKDDTYWKGYIDKQNEDAEICKICTYRSKANKYDALVNTIREEIEKRNIQAREHKDEKILTIIEREKLTLQDLLETIEGEKK